MSVFANSTSLPTVLARVSACDARPSATYRSLGIEPRVTVEFEPGQILELKESSARQVELPLMKVGDPVQIGYAVIEPHRFLSVESVAIDWGKRKTFKPSRRPVTYKESGRVIRKEDVVEIKADGRRCIMSHLAVELVDADGKTHTVTFRLAATRDLVMANVGCCVDLTYSPNYSMDASVTVKKIRIDWDATIQAREFFKHWSKRLVANRKR